jgi:hypothetical protein
MNIDSRAAEVGSNTDPGTQPTHQLRHCARVLLLCLHAVDAVIDTSVVTSPTCRTSRAILASPPRR